MDLIKVFVSYTDSDSVVAHRIANLLQRHAVSTFIGSRIPIGPTSSEGVSQAIAESTLFLCVVSSASLRSRWVLEELSLARQHGLHIFPVLLERDLQLASTFEPDKDHATLYEQSCSDDDIIDSLVHGCLFDDGIVPAGLAQSYNKRFPGETFASELLTQPIFLSKRNGCVEVHVNRAEVSACVISTTGKTKLCELSVAPKRQEWAVLDARILDFMRSAEDGQDLCVNTEDLPLRWASGGVFSIIRWPRNGHWWVPVFFRDIEPSGWNISLGASERSVAPDDRARLDLKSFSTELRAPWHLIVREFLEETLVLRDEPRLGATVLSRQLLLNPNLIQEHPRALAGTLADSHIALRRNLDGLYLQRDPQGIELSDPQGTDVRLFVTDPGGTPALGQPTERNVLVAINPLELGIEVVKVLEYELEESNYILDGELYTIAGEDKMVRMPVALVSLEYLYRAFGARDYYPAYMDAPVQPSVEGPAFANGDVHVWRWDVDRRKDVWGRMAVRTWERTRYDNWKKFHEHAFLDGLAGNTARFPALFTPTTAKIANLFFNCSSRGRELAAQFAIAPGAAVPPPPPAPTPPPPPREGRRRALAMPDGAGGSDDGLLARFCVGWKDYDTQARAFLAALGIRWEPIELGAPPTPTAWTYGFELLGEGPAGENFPCLVEAAAQFHVTPVDLRVALVVKALEAIRALRAALRTAFGPRADALRLTVNVDEVLVGSPAFVEAIRHSQVDENTLFEVNEALPLAQVNDLMRIAAAYRLNLALDDSNNLDHAVRHALLHRVKLVKVDHGFTRQQFRQMSNLRPRQVMDALVALRAPEAPLVLEGIESRLEADFIQAHWQESDGPLYFQGWSIRLGAELRRFFEPVNTEEQPKGYRMR